jgi:DHA1 family inner membrane transport protein
MTGAWPKAAPDGLVAAVLLAFVATAGLFYVNIEAAIVDGLQTALRFSPRDANFTASANVYGAAVGAFSAVFFVRRLHWRRVALVALVLLMTIDLVSSLVRQAPVLMGLRLVDGVIGGFLVGTTFAVIARTKTPDRVFGMLLVLQFGAGGLGLMVLPKLVPTLGAPILFYTLAGFSLLTLILTPFLDDYRIPAPVAGDAPQARPKTPWLMLAAALAAVFLFQAANMALAANILGLGRAYGLKTAYESDVLGVATWIGALGAVAVIVMGLRFGRTGPLVAGMVATVAGTAVFLVSDRAHAYAAANIVTSVTWSFVISYLLGLCAAFDPSGRAAALGGFCSKVGLASGPAVTGVLLDHHVGYPRLIPLALVGLAIAAVAAAWPALRLDRRAAKTAERSP